jgi:hypothetical protein
VVIIQNSLTDLEQKNPTQYHTKKTKSVGSFLDDYPFISKISKFENLFLNIDGGGDEMKNANFMTAGPKNLIRGKYGE